MQSFCDHCGRYVNGIKNSLSREVIIKGESIIVNYTSDVCPYCCEELYNEDMESEIMTMAKAQYKKKMHLLSETAIVKYMKINHIDNEQMAKLLDCTVQELIAVRVGGIQSSDLDKKMRKVIKKTA